MLLLSVQGHYSIAVEVMNENDNRPKFQRETVEQLSISEVKPPHHPETRAPPVPRGTTT